jgi:hypothetical protein
MSDRQDLVEYDGGQLSQFDDIGADVRDAYERHKTSTEVIEYDNSRSLTDVIHGAVDHHKTKAENRARQEYGSGAQMARLWRAPRSIC